jgi:hypothetical protein
MSPCQSGAGSYLLLVVGCFPQDELRRGEAELLPTTLEQVTQYILARWGWGSEVPVLWMSNNPEVGMLGGCGCHLSCLKAR